MSNNNNRNIYEVMKDEVVMRNKIVDQLRNKPCTIPEIAEILDKPCPEVMSWIMSMWRYGLLEETGKPNADGYYKYRLVE